MLAVDIGNTFTRIVSFSGQKILRRQSVHTRGIGLKETAAALSAVRDTASSGRVWISSVAPSVNAVVDSAAERMGLERRFIRPGVDDIIPHRLRTPASTGADRLLSSLAAGAMYFSGSGGSRGYVTIQCGSAVTIDLVNGDGVFLGGYILPGPAMWLSSLSSAAQLPDLSNEIPDWSSVAPGDNTRDAILNGMAAALPLAVASAAVSIDVHPSLAPVPGQKPNGPPVITTGGWGEVVAGMLGGRTPYNKDLVLHGIRIFAERHE